MKVRPPAVAGSFYPGDAKALRQMVERLLASVVESPTWRAPDGDSPIPRAMIVPHAGYIYSGSTAALAYAQLIGLTQKVRHVVIVGPTHRVGIEGVALVGADELATPLGHLPVWQQGSQIAKTCAGVVISDHAHAQEHSLEVQLPFLQVALPDVDVLPLAASWVTPAVVAAVLEALWDQPQMLILISSDLSHYHPYAQAQAIDQATVDQILALEANIDHDQACGATGINAMLLVARAHQLRPRLDRLCNSGDTAGDKTGVVGYTAISFFEPGTS